MSLEHLGYHAVGAASGVEALEHFIDDLRAFDLVILDMLMPNLPGERVFRKLREIRADIRVLAMSGYTPIETVRSILAEPLVDFIQKPFTMEELSRRVRALLDLDPENVVGAGASPSGVR
jgi:DNA-binding response OmpR family regulator